MPHENNSHSRKLLTLLLVGGWLVWSMGIGHGTFVEGDELLMGFTTHDLVSILVIYLFARLHDLEVNMLLENAAGVRSGSDDASESDDE